MHSEGHSQGHRVWAGAFVALVLLFEFSPLAQASGVESIEQRIALEIALIHDGERNGLEPVKIGRLWAHLGIDYKDEGAYVESEDAYNHALKLFGASPEGAAEYAITLDNLGSLYLIKGELNAAEEIRKRSMKLREAAGDQLQIARARAHLAEVAFARHKYKEAEEGCAEAYREMVNAKDPSADDLVFALITLTYSSGANRKNADAVTYGTDALTQARAAFPANSLQVGGAQVALGYAEWKAGKKEDADRDMREGLESLREGIPRGHPYLLGSLRQYSDFLEQTGRKREARQIAEEEKRLQAPANGCRNCTISVYGLRAK